MKNITVSETNVGEKVIVDKNFYYIVQGYSTKSENKTILESHRKYADIQIMVSGEEQMDLVDISRLTIKENYDPENDIMFWNIPKRMVRLTLTAGDSIVLYPENAYRRVAINENESRKVLKIVGKVKIAE